MNNPFHQIEDLIDSEAIQSQDLVHALLATTFLECCDQCSARFRSEEFLNAFKKLIDEMKLCRELSKRNAA